MLAKRLPASMLKENPQKRPNVYEVVREACRMRGKDVPIRDVCHLKFPLCAQMLTVL